MSLLVEKDRFYILYIYPFNFQNEFQAADIKVLISVEKFIICEKLIGNRCENKSDYKIDSCEYFFNRVTSLWQLTQLFMGSDLGSILQM